MLVGYAKVSSENNCQNTNLQTDILKAENMDSRNFFLIMPLAEKQIEQV